MPIRCIYLQRGFLRVGLGERLQVGLGLLDASEADIAAEDDHGFKERGRVFASADGDTEGLEHGSGLEAKRSGGGSEGLVERVVIKSGYGEDLLGVLEDAEGHGDIATFRRDKFCGVVGSKFLEEEKVGGRGGFAEELDALADERGDGEKLLRRGGKAGLLEEGQEAGAELFDGERTDVLGVEPEGLGVEGVVVREVDYGVGAVDGLECEGLDEFVEGEELAVIFGGPAEEAEEVDEGLGEETCIAVGGDADYGAVLALGELGAVWGDEQGEMGELGRLDAQSLKDEQVLEGVGEVILASDDVADAEIGVVNAGGEVVGGHRIRAQEGEVFNLVCEFGLRTVDAVSEMQGAALATGDTIAEGEGLAGGGATIRLFAGELRHAGIEEPGTLRGGLIVIPSVGGGEVAIGKAFGEDCFSRLAVEVKALGLLVLFVPCEAQPVESLKDGLDASLSVALDISVIQAQDEGAVIVAGKEPIEDEGARSAHVQVAGGRRGKTDAGRGGGGGS